MLRLTRLTTLPEYNLTLSTINMMIKLHESLIFYLLFYTIWNSFYIIMLDGVGIKDVFTIIVAIQDKLLFNM